MDKSKAKTAALTRRQRRVRGKVAGTAERPRLRVSRSNQHIYAQLIDDVAGTTLVSASSIDPELASPRSCSTAADVSIMGAWLPSLRVPATPA
jgi:large subunit ribosomal protein L18